MTKSSKKKKASSAKTKKQEAGLVIWLAIMMFSLPILYSTKTSEPSIPIRWLLLALSTSALIVYFLLYKKLHLGWSRLSWPVRSFIIATCLFWLWGWVSTGTSVSPHVSAQEMLRLAPILILAYLAFLAQKIYPASMKWIYRAIAVSAGIQGLVTVGQGWGLEPLLAIPGKGGKLYGFMANGVLLGAAQAMALPFIWIATRDKAKSWAIISKLSMSLVVASIVVSASRSPWLATLMGIVPILLILVYHRSFFREYPKRLLQSGWFYILLSILVSASVLATNKKVKDSVGARAMVAATDSLSVKRLNQSRANVNVRLEMWEVALSKIADHPLLGIGPATWMIMSPIYEGSRRPDLRYYTKIIRPHNTYLQMANEYGVPGLLLFLALLAIPAWTAFRQALQAKPEIAFVNSALLGVLFAIGTDFMFSFPQERMVHPSYLALASGIILGLGSNKSKTSSNSGQTLVWAVLLLVALASAYGALERIQFEYHWRYAKAYLDQKEYDKCLESSALARSPLIKVGPIANTVEVSEAQALKNLGRYEEAEQVSYRGLSYHPNNFALLNNLGTIYFEQELFDSAIIYYDQARQLTPAEPLVLRNLAITYGKMSDYENCIATIEKIAEEDRTEGITQWYLYSKQELRNLNR